MGRGDPGEPDLKRSALNDLAAWVSHYFILFFFHHCHRMPHKNDFEGGKAVSDLWILWFENKARQKYQVVGACGDTF